MTQTAKQEILRLRAENEQLREALKLGDNLLEAVADYMMTFQDHDLEEGCECKGCVLDRAYREFQSALSENRSMGGMTL
jgi:hypothetical protein